MTIKKIPVAKIAEILKAELIGNPNILIEGVNNLPDARENELSFLGNQKYLNQVATTKAAAVIVPPNIERNVPAGKAWLICDSPNIAFSKAVNYFAPAPVEFKQGIHPTAVIDPSARVASSCHIGPHAVIEPGVEIGEKTIVLSGVYIGHETKIGKNCLIYPNVVIRERCRLGNNVIVHPNVSIGADGYGFEAGPFGIVKIPQVGIVQIDDDVEIGSNSTIDRARFSRTWIKSGVKIDDQVHVAHNAVVGEFSMLIGQCGIAGSSKIGQGVIIAAQAGINHHTVIGDGAKIAGTSGVTKDVPPGGVYAGTPAEPAREFMERITLPKSVAKLKAKIKELEAEVKALKAQMNNGN